MGGKRETEQMSVVRFAIPETAQMTGVDNVVADSLCPVHQPKMCHQDS